MAKYLEITEENLDQTIKEGVTMLDFWAPWCRPCRMIAPIIDELAEDFDGKATIAKVNTDEQPEIATKFKIKFIPTILFFKDGELVDQMLGASGKELFTDKLNKILS